MSTLSVLLSAVSIVLCHSQSIKITNFPGAGEYWYAVQVEAPNGAYVTSVKVKDSKMTEFEEGLGAFDYYHGQFFQWYDYTHMPYTAPFSFEVTLSTGQVMSGTNVLSGYSTSESGEISMAGGMAFVNADAAMNGEEEAATQGLSSGAIAGLVIVGVMVGCLMGALCMVCYQKKKNKVAQSGPSMEKVEDEEVMVDVRVINTMQLGQ